MNNVPDNVWQRLVSAGMVSGTAPATPEPDSPWFVKLLLAASGWLASLFLLASLALLFKHLFESQTASLITGGVLVVLAAITLKKMRNDFFEHSALALSLAGQGLVAVGLLKFSEQLDTTFFWMMAVFQIILCFVVPSYVHRVWSACIVVLSVFFALQRPELHHLVAGAAMFGVSSVWLNEYTFPNQFSRNTAMAYGATIAVFIVSAFPMLGVHVTELRAAIGVGPADAEWYELPMVGKFLVFVVLLYAVGGVMRRYSLNTRQQRWVVLAAIALGVVSFNVPGITIGVILLLLGFSGSNNVLTSIGFVTILCFFSSYYYQLEQTLLVKSGIFASLGLSLLVLRLVLPRTAVDKAASTDKTQEEL